MARLKRFIANQYAIEIRGSEDPPIKPEEVGLVEIVDTIFTDVRDAMPQSQKDAEAATLKAEIKAVAKAFLNGNEPINILLRNIIKLLIVRANDQDATLKTTCQTSTNTNLRANLITAIPGPVTQPNFLADLEDLIDAEIL